MQQMGMITVTAEEISPEGAQWAFFPKALLILIWRSCLRAASFRKRWRNHMAATCWSPFDWENRPGEIKESESTGWFAGSFCLLNSTSKIILSNRFKGTLTKLPAACIPGGKLPRSIHGEDILHDNVTHSYNAFNSLSHPNNSSSNTL